jgi:signal transduction histidine kinase
MRLIPSHFNLKQRVVWALTTLVALFVIMQAVLAYLSMAEQEDDLVDQLVAAEAKRLARHVAQDDVPGMQAADLLTLSPDFSAWLKAADGSVTPSPVPESIGQLSLGPHRLKPEIHVYVKQIPSGILYVRYDAGRHEENVHQFGFYLAGLGVLCIAVAALASTQIAAVVVSPIDRVTRLLSEWAPGSMPTEDEDEEVRMLAAFRRVQERFEESIAYEREFVANARHEIGTPLTALRTDLEMLAVHANESLQPRLQRAIASVDEIAGSLDLAHTLAQRQTPNEEAVDLASCVDAAWASLDGAEGTAKMVFRNQVGADVCIVADRHALLTILRNLMRNAAEHAAASTCTVRHTPRGIEVDDDGIGIAPEDLPLVFDRYYRGRRVDAPEQERPGAERSVRGLGLAIARQIADLNGWQLTVESGPGAGTRFILRLTPR